MYLWYYKSYILIRRLFTCFFRKGDYFMKKTIKASHAAAAAIGAGIGAAFTLSRINCIRKICLTTLMMILMMISMILMMTKKTNPLRIPVNMSICIRHPRRKKMLNQNQPKMHLKTSQRKTIIPELKPQKKNNHFPAAFRLTNILITPASAPV